MNTTEGSHGTEKIQTVILVKLEKTGAAQHICYMGPWFTCWIIDQHMTHIFSLRQSRVPDMLGYQIANQLTGHTTD